MQIPFHHALMKAHLMLHRRVMEQAKALGLTSGQPKILEFLSRQEGADQATIAHACEIEPATVSSILARMEQAGLIERRRTADDRRVLHIYLTEAGRAAWTKMSDVFAKAEDAAAAGMSAEERAALREGLETVCRNLAQRR